MNEREVFEMAMQKPKGQERSDYLDVVCGDNADLRRRIEGLLAEQENLGSFLEKPPAGLEPTTFQPLMEGPSTRIGPYKLLQQIGEGGMGAVYMAEQKEPVERRVALKIIKPGMDSRQVIARFEAERQALALMDHPNIARVLDAGTTESGRPYFVMELVKGVPIIQYCDEHQLTPRERLQLFLPVCQAVQHAHQKGIIHRDLKPTNLLVAEYDQQVIPKIIDFGIAKAIGHQLTEKTMFTEFGQVVGTIEYMSPEQAKLNQLDIDTRTDVYSLGVLLYELLTGETPLDRRRLRSAAFDEMLRIIREEEPQRPSVRLSSINTLASVAASRHTEPKQLTMLVRGELDWIVMKALEKDRNRRYETANGLGADIQRYLNDEQVFACPPSTGYRLRKFARRNKAALATSAIVAAALLLGIIVSTSQAIRAMNAEDLAQQLLHAEREARNDTERARQQAEQSRDGEAMQRLLAQKNAVEADAQRRQAEANFAKAREAVDEYLTHVTENELLTVPGMQPLRENLLTAALEFYTDFTQGRADDWTLRRDLAFAHLRLATIHRELRHGEAFRAANREAIRLFEELQGKEPAEADVQLGLANAYFLSKRFNDTVKLCRAVLERDPMHAKVRTLLAGTYNELAIIETRKNRIQEARGYHQQAVDLRESLVRDYPNDPEHVSKLGSTLNNLGVLLGKEGKKEEALIKYQLAVEHAAQAYEREPHSLLWGHWLYVSLRNVAKTQAELKQVDDALRTFERVISVSRKRAFENPAVPGLRGDLGKAHLELATFQQERGNTADAGRSYQAAREAFESIPRATPPYLYELASVYAAIAQPPSDGTAPTQQDAAEQQRHADLAVSTLKKAVESGYANVQAIKSNRLFDVLRERADFQQLVATMAKVAEPTRPESKSDP